MLLSYATQEYTGVNKYNKISGRQDNRVNKNEVETLVVIPTNIKLHWKKNALQSVKSLKIMS